MNEKCFTRNPLVRDGTSQEQRLLETLLPAYVAVDERDMTDLTKFAAKFASEIQYYNTSHTKDGDWSNFFKLTNDWNNFSLEEYLDNLKIDQEGSPHLALFFGFLYMFKVAQDDINTITQRHLDFYYREVLQLEEKSAVPDQVALIFKLAKHVKTHLIKKGTILKAGKDDAGVQIYYEVDEDVAINKTTISELKAVYTSRSSSHEVYASPVANSEDGQGADIENEEQSWRTFGKPAEGASNRDLATLGFAFAAPVLHMAEGTRTVTISLRTNTNIFSLKLSDTILNVYFSGEKEWIKADSCRIVPVDSSGSKLDKDAIAKIYSSGKHLDLDIEATLIADQDAVVAYDKETLLEPFDTIYPIVKIELVQEKAGLAIYKKLKDLYIAHAKIAVDVKGVKNLILQNDQAEL